MDKEDRLSRPDIKITKESLGEWRMTIASLREQKGKEDDTLTLIRIIREQAEKLNEWEHVANFWWEESLVWQHIVMDERDKPEAEKDEKRKKEALEQMGTAASQADSVINKHDLEEIKADSLRFLGRVATYNGEYERSKWYYKNGIELFKGKKEPLRRVRRLELQGFLANSMIMLGEVSGGVELGTNTFKEYDTADEAVLLKETDYYTWAVWKSGAVIGVCHALIAKDENSTLKSMEGLLGEAERILTIPDDNPTWGDKTFEFRKNEIAAIRQSLSVL